MEYIINLTNTITSYIFSFFVKENVPSKSIEMIFIDDVDENEVDELINSVKKDIANEKQTTEELEIRYLNFVKEYNDMILLKKSYEEQENEESENNNSDDENDDGKVPMLA